MKKLFTLCLIYKNQKILLGVGKRGLNKGKWNGFGGKVEELETIEEAAVREVREEIGVEVKNLEKIGINNFHLPGAPYVFEVHTFKTDTFIGEPEETDEMSFPRWFDVSEIPFDKMWPDDKHWFPLFLSCKKFKGDFFFDGLGEVTNYDLKEVENL